MIKTLEIKNNTIQLPPELKDKLKNKKAVLNDYGEIITLTIIPFSKESVQDSTDKQIKASLTNLKKAASLNSTQALRELGGSLKGKIKIDPAKWQKEIRKQWERKIV